MLRRVAQLRTINLVLGALCVGCVIPAYAEHTELAAPVRARMDSPVLWSMTLQHPDQAIGRYIRLRDDWQEAGVKYRLLVRLQDPYEGAGEVARWKSMGCLSAHRIPQLPVGTLPQHWVYLSLARSSLGNG